MLLEEHRVCVVTTCLSLVSCLPLRHTHTHTQANLVKEASERVKGLKKHKHLAAEKAAEQEGADGAEPMAE